MEYIKSGKLKPIKPVTLFDAVDSPKAFGYMQTGKHMGKVLIKMPDDASLIPASRNLSLFTLASDVSYLLVGGLGGLGRAVATWMVEKGARNFVFLSRSAGMNSGSISFIKELESQGCVVTAISGSVDNMQDVQRAVLACNNRIGGVLQMSMVIRVSRSHFENSFHSNSSMQSQILSKMTHDEWVSSLAPKVQGTWNLHHAMSGHNLDFFVCFISLSGLCGNPGQAHYAAANSFLDAFVKYRQGQNLVASAINIGLMDDAGFAYENMPKLLQHAYSASVQTVTEVDLLRSLELAMIQSGQFANGLGTTKALSDPGVIPPWSQDARYGLWRRMVSSEGQSSTTTLHGEVKEIVEMIQRDPQVLEGPATESRLMKLIGREIGSHIADTSCMDDNEIQQIVIESLLMIEIKSWARRHLGLELSLAVISNASTIGGLGKVTISALRAMYQTGDADMKTSKSSLKETEDPHLRDLLLGQDLHPMPGPVPEWHSESEGHVLLTGATGLWGAFMLSLLSEITSCSHHHLLGSSF
jgi:NAD(P)-dependent dehydrogenase (short-subunit alcohol dehydrogenase family)